MTHATIDFETRSAADLRTAGGWNYSRHSSTEAMILSYMLPDDIEPKHWTMALPAHGIKESPLPLDLFKHIENGGLVEAHNAFFETCIWNNIMVLRHFWPEIKPEQWRCSAAKASACSLPRDLEGACTALNLDIRKDLDGRRLMLKMCKPRKPRKDEAVPWTLAGKPALWHDNPDDFARLIQYCDQDVLAEHALSAALPELSETELKVWQLDQRMNLKGVLFDLDMAESAIELACAWRSILNAELFKLTGIASATKRADLKAWLATHEGLFLTDTTKQTMERYLSRPTLSKRARRVLKIIIDVNKTSTSKYKAMLERADGDDWRARDLFMYHGAGTGRWAGKGIQVQNLPSQNLIFKDFNLAVEVIKKRDIELCELLYVDILDLLSHASRGAIMAPPGHELIMADFASIEARNVLWLANARSALDIFRRGEDIYCDMATGIYGFKVDKHKHPRERQMGKQAILGLGYGMGFVTFLLTCRKYKIYMPYNDVLQIMGKEAYEAGLDWMRNYLCLDRTPADRDEYANVKKIKQRFIDQQEDLEEIIHELVLMKHIVGVYRERYPEVKQLWNDQERAAIKATYSWQQAVRGNEHPTWDTVPEERKQLIQGKPITAGKIIWQVVNNFLICTLPSGRQLRYYSPKIRGTKTSWGETKPSLTYKSVNGVSRKFEITYTYGGKIVENITQAVARDIMAEAMLRIDEQAQYTPIMSVHDELVCEVPTGKGNIEEFERLMCVQPKWAPGCPIAAEADISLRYKK